ncbi:PQQ-like beta-propeller repeat protein [Pendulispora brunnea]|uniref:PQQ-like beta-propeller repeat protein n=1 Tax=Pendulispora brunnea TaxID=2905690 RepID=A0ABZ2JVS9_9BACT
MYFGITRIARTWIALFGITAFGCAANAPDNEPNENGHDTVSAAAAPEDDALCGPGQPPGGTVVWKRDLGLVAEDLGPATVAFDRTGNAFQARPDAGTAKLDASGNIVWQKPGGNAVAVNRTGDVYLAGEAGLSKLDADGNAVWSRAIGSGAAQSLAISADGNILASGAKLGTVRLDAEGNVVWSKPFGGHVAFGADGAVLVTGYFHGTVDFGGGSVTSRGRADAFIVSLSATGAHQWSSIVGDADLPIARPSGGFVTDPSDQIGEAIAAAPNGDVLVAGLAVDSVKLFGENVATPFSEDAGVLPLAFVARLDKTGKLLWAKREDAVRDVRGIASDARGNMILSGGLVGNALPKARTWIEKLDPAGAVTWRHEESFGVGFGDAVTTDRCGNVLFSVTAADEAGGKVHSVLFKLRR